MFVDTCRILKNISSPGWAALLCSIQSTEEWTHDITAGRLGLLTWTVPWGWVITRHVIPRRHPCSEQKSLFQLALEPSNNSWVAKQSNILRPYLSWQKLANVDSVGQGNYREFISAAWMPTWLFMPYGSYNLFRCLFLTIFSELIFRRVECDTIHQKHLTSILSEERQMGTEVKGHRRAPWDRSILG